MKKNIKNKTRVEGYLFGHTLELKVSGPQSKNPGTSFIAGTLDIAVDDEGMNVITTNFTYVTPVYSKSGKPNATFGVLQKIINEGKTFAEFGTSATKIGIDGSISLNDFYAESREPGKEGELELVSAIKNEGSFVNILTALNPNEDKRHEFDVDMVITSTARKEANEEKGYPEQVSIKGVVFDFRNAILPVTFTTTDTNGGMDYFEGCGATSSDPLFININGLINNVTTIQKKESQGAFGGAKVDEVKRSHKEWNVTWASGEPFEFGDENVLTMAELQKAGQDREVYLAGVKQRRIDYMNSKDSTPAPASAAAPSAPVAAGQFNF